MRLALGRLHGPSARALVLVPAPVRLVELGLEPCHLAVAGDRLVHVDGQAAATAVIHDVVASLEQDAGVDHGATA
jgi:hypothetical protein